MKPLHVLRYRPASAPLFQFLSRRCNDVYSFKDQNRYTSSATSTNNELTKEIPSIKSDSKSELPPLSVMPSTFLLRSFMITSILSSPRALNLLLPIMSSMAGSKSWWLNPDKNPVLHKITRVMFYDHFCAGENENEVKKTVATMKKIGFKGVILGYAKEVIMENDADQGEVTGLSAETQNEQIVEKWKEGTLQTLKMIDDGDFLAIKFTGAGPIATEALLMKKSLPPQMYNAMKTILDIAAQQNTRVWIDAEQQVVQDTIDAWTISLMREYNTNGRAILYNTMQAYLKSTPSRISQHLALAASEGWLLGIKLVRGAYIASEPRHLIHDTKAETDAAYNSIAEGLLTGNFPGIEGPGKPYVRVFLAGHNEESVQKACAIHRERVLAGKPVQELELGQLHGMADELSCRIIQAAREAETEGLAPRPFKCLAWGTNQECMQFLVRRAVENKGAVERTKDWKAGIKDELWRRFSGILG